MTTRVLIAGLGLVCFGLVGCDAPADGEPPTFNAIDPSVQCEAGKIGWDFTTGGNDTDIVTQDVSREIKVVEATFGGSCGAAVGNYTSTFALECDGQTVCTRQVSKTGDAAVGCSNRDFRVKYRCGDEAATYDVTYPADAANTSVTLSCGVQLTVISGTYPIEKTPRPNGNLTNAIAQACSGKRRCSIDTPQGLFGATDPLPNVRKSAEIHYICGGEPQDTIVNVAQDKRIDFYCGTKEVKARPVELIRVRTARLLYPIKIYPYTPSPTYTKAQYDANVAYQRAKAQSIADTVLQRASAACDGKRTCSFTPPKGNDNETPAEIQMPDNPLRDGGVNPTKVLRSPLQQVVVEYWCGNEEAANFKHFEILNRANALEPQPVTLNCGQPVRFVDLTQTSTGSNSYWYVSNEEAKADFVSQCSNNQRVCRLPGYMNSFRIADGKRVGSLHITYTCGDLTAPTFTSDIDYTTVDPRGGQIECPPFDENVFSGIRIKSVTPVEQTVGVTQACFGKDFCKAPSGTTVQYRCGDAPELFTATANTLLNCRPRVNVVGVKNCAGIELDMNQQYTFQNSSYGNSYSFKTYCDYSQGECNLNAVNFACTTGEWRWTCGSDPTVHTQATGNYRDFNGPGYQANILKCATPTTPYINKKCVPLTCTGKTRRDKELNCQADNTMAVLHSVSSTPTIVAWFPDAGVASRTDATVTTLKEDVPYRTNSFTTFTKLNAADSIGAVQVAVWAYDEFRRKADAGPSDAGVTDGGVVPGYRCGLMTARVTDPDGGTSSNVAVQAFTRGAVLSPQCYRQEVVDDAKTAWSDAARRVGVTEVVFRRDYERVATKMATSFDVNGQNLTSTGPLTGANAAFAKRTEPVGFFYDPARQWIDLYSFYMQTSKKSEHVAIEFVESKDIEISAYSATLRQLEGFVAVQDDTQLPTFGVDVEWYQRGDSPLKNPLSPNTRLTANTAQPLSTRNLRGFIEMARVDSTLTNPWVASNTVRFPATALPGGNAFSRTDKLVATMTPEIRRRLLTVRTSSNDGFMSDDLNDVTAFKIRACLEFDGVTHTLGAAASDLDNKNVSAQRDGATYTVGIGKRCSEAVPYTIYRDLFVRPAIPIQETVVNTDKGGGQTQGNSLVGSGNDVGSQQQCGKQCTSNNDCTNMGTCTIPAGQSIGTCSASQVTPDNQYCIENSRSGMGTTGNFGRSIYSSKSKNVLNQSASTTQGNSDATAELLSYNMLDMSESSMSAVRDTKKSFKLVISPNFGGIIDIVNRLRGAPGNKPWFKKKRSNPYKNIKKIVDQAGREGLEFGISREFQCQIGPVPVGIEIGASVGFGLKLTFETTTDRQTFATMNSPRYPCLKASGAGSKCYESKTSALSFTDALNTCRFEGGRLAELRDAAAATAVDSAIGTTDGGVYWIGGQAAYAYSGACNTQEPKSTACLDSSRTGYSWLSGDTLFAKQAGRATALVSPDAYANKHAFTLTALSSVRTLVPNKAGVGYNPVGRVPSVLSQDESHPFVCEFDPADSYMANDGSVEVEVEFSAGLNGSVCVPSTRIGFCLTAELKFITAAFVLTSETEKTSIFKLPTDRKPSLITGNKKLNGKANLAFLSGALKGELRFFFSSAEWEFAKWDGVKSWEWNLFESENPYRTIP